MRHGERADSVQGNDIKIVKEYDTHLTTIGC